MNLTLPENSSTTPVNPNPAQVSYTAEEIALWQLLASNASRYIAVDAFERITGKAHDAGFLI